MSKKKQTAEIVEQGKLEVEEIKSKHKDISNLRGMAALHRLGGLTLSGALVAVSLAMIALGMLNVYTTSESVELYNGKLMIDSEYQVQIQPNSVITERTLGEGLAYPQSLLKQIDIRFYGDYISAYPASITGEYDLFVRLTGTYSANSGGMVTIYDKKFPLASGQKIQGEDSLSFSSEAAIDLNKYWTEINTANDVLGFSLPSTIEVVMEGNVRIETAEEPIEKEFYYAFPLPTSGTMLMLQKPSIYSDNATINKMAENTVYPYRQYVPLSAGLAVAACAVLVLLMMKTRPFTPEEQKRHAIRKAFRQHAGRLVKLDSLPEAMDQKPQLSISTMDGLVRVSDEMQRSIVYIPDEQGLPREGKLYVIAPDQLYCLTL